MKKFDNIKGYPGYYISKKGNLFTRFKSEGIKGKGLGRRGCKQILSDRYRKKALTIKSNGYVQSHLSKDGCNHKFYIHRLVYEAWVAPIPEGMQIDHIDGNRSNNKLSNLRCVTPSVNSKHKYELGYIVHNKYVNFTDDERCSIISDYKTMSIAKLAIKYGYSRYFIHQVVLGKR